VPPLALTDYEIGLLAVAAVFIAFALIVALVIPRSRPTFPGGRLGVFVAICVILFLAQMGAVLALAELGHEEEHGEAVPPTATVPTAPVPTDTEPQATEPEATGDAVAGKVVFLEKCADCHTLADAETTGSVGPNLDAAAPAYDRVVDRVTNGAGVMPSFEGQLTEQQIQDVAAYVSSAAG
jgi:mono/diheme cytochrome c family protein